MSKVEDSIIAESDDQVKWLARLGARLVEAHRKIIGKPPSLRSLRKVVLRPPRDVGSSLDAHHGEMAEARLHAVQNRPCCCLDNGPTGVGKSFADIPVLKHLNEEAMQSVTLLPTHSHCREVVQGRERAGVQSVAYPQLSEETCLRHDEAEKVLRYGLPVTRVLCPDCPFAEGCEYREQVKAAREAQHLVATLARAAVSAREVTTGRHYVSLHENPLDMLCPTFPVSRGLLAVELVARQAEGAAASPNDRGCYRRLAALAKDLDGWHHGSYESAEVPLPSPARHVPKTLHRDLFEAVQALGLPGVVPEAMKLALAALLGQLVRITVELSERPTRGKDGKQTTKLVRILTGYGRTDLPASACVVFNDATATAEEIRAVTGRHVHVITPRGRLERKKRVVQVIPAGDVTMTRKAGPVADILRGVLHDLPQYRRVGLLTHQKLSHQLPRRLGEPYASRLSLVTYFGSGLSRGSNVWPEQCDALVILGTPRVGSDAVRQHLVRLGKFEAARKTRAEVCWHRDSWTGRTESGKLRTVATPHYADPDWHAAYCSLVGAEFKQSIGRGRGILPGGIPVYVVTTEDLGDIALADEGRFEPLTVNQATLLSAFRPDGRSVARGTRELAELLGFANDRDEKDGKGMRRMLRMLTILESQGRVKRCPPKGKWYIPVR